MSEGLSLPPCPNSPNCVSSQSPNPEQYVEPLSYTGPLTEAKNKIRSLFQGQSRTRIVLDQDAYLHIEITSFIFRFVDDVEFLFDEGQQLIHIRSASRAGYWDLGVNRKRIETLRAQYRNLS